MFLIAQGYLPILALMRKAISIPALVVCLAGLGLIGATSASASVLCAGNENPCSIDKGVAKGEAFNLKGKMTFGLGFYAVSCSAQLSLKTTNAGGEGEAVNAQAGLSLSGECPATEHPGCAATLKSPPSSVSFAGSGGSGSMSLSPMQIQFHCMGPVFICTVSTESTELTFSGGSPGVVSLAGKTPPNNCPTSAIWSAEFSSNGPTGTPMDLFTVAGPAPGPATRLCSFAFLFEVCPVTLRYPTGTTIEAALEGNSVFEFLYEGKLREPACETGSLTGKTTEAGKPLIGEVSALSFGKCGAGVCAVEAQNLSYEFELERTTGINGTLEIVGGAGTPKLEVNCGKAFKCIYKATATSFALTGGSPAKLAVAQTLEKDASSEAECGSTMTWKATYKLTKPTTLAITP